MNKVDGSVDIKVIKRGEDADSDVDTDDLIISGNEFPSQQNSFVENKLSTEEVSNSAENTPLSQQLPPGASASSLYRPTKSYSTVKRALNFDCVSQENTASDIPKSCLKLPVLADSPLKSTNLSVSFDFDNQNVLKKLSNVPDFSSNSIEKYPEGIIHSEMKKYCANLEKIFINLKCDFRRFDQLTKLNQMTDSFTIEQQDGNCKNASDAFLKNLSTSDLRELLNSENLKREYCERKIEMLNQRCLYLEQRLAVSESHISAQKITFDEAEKILRAMNDTFFEREKNLIELFETTNRDNISFKENLAISKAHVQSLNARLKESELKLNSTSQLSIERREVLNLRLQCDSLAQNVEKSQLEKQKLGDSLKKSEESLRNAHEHQEGTVKELCHLENVLKICDSENCRLRAQISAEKNASRLELEQKRSEYSIAIKSVKNDWERRLKQRLDENACEHSAELLNAKNTCELALRSAADQTARLKTERDQLNSKLMFFERQMDSRYATMEEDLRRKLHDKYRQLVAEFRGVRAGSSDHQDSGSNPPQMCHGGNLAQEFLDELQEAVPIITPRSIGNGNSVANSERKSRLQDVLKQMLPINSTTISHGLAHFSTGQNHPCDPAD